jgi:tight adherence protein C
MTGMASVVVVLGFVALYGIFWFRLIGRNRRERKRGRYGWCDPLMELLKWRGIFEQLQPILHRPRMALAVMEGGICPPERLLRWTAEGVGMAYGALLVCWLLVFASGNLAVAGIGTLAAGCIPVLRARDLGRQLERRRQAVLMELPVLLSRLLVMVNAGENVMRALHRSMDRQSAKGEHPLYDELRSALAAMQRGESMNLAMEEFGRRCAVPEAKLFAATLLMNAKRGGDEFVPALRDLTRQMWEKRKTVARTLGEQASSRLAFPLAVVFLLIVVLVGAPTLLMM